MIVPVMAISNLVLTQQIYSEETNGAHADYREPVPLKKRKFHFFTRPRNDSACGHFPASFPHIVDTSSSIIPCVWM